MEYTLIVNPGSQWLKATVFTTNGEVYDTQKCAVTDTSTWQNWLISVPTITQVGVRVVHGGTLSGPQLFDDAIKEMITRLITFAPLHNPIALQIIEDIQTRMPLVPIWCVFDTDFHKSMPLEASTYPIDQKIAQEYSIRKYGFHGVALESVVGQLRDSYKQREDTFPEKLIAVHLGGGSSVTAIEDGRSVATSMGATPLQGVMMITRSGSVDPDIARILYEAAGYNAQKVSDMLNKESGWYGLTGSKDIKMLIEKAMDGSQPECLAFDMYIQSVVAHIFQCYGVLQGVDAMTLSGGIGFHNEYVRTKLLHYTKLIGLHNDNTFVFQADEARTIFQKIRQMPC